MFIEAFLVVKHMVVEPVTGMLETELTKRPLIITLLKNFNFKTTSILYLLLYI